MSSFNNKNRLDNPNGSVEIESIKAMQTASETKKTPWHLRFAPGDILRKSGIIAIIAVVALLAPISAMALHPVVVFLLGWGAGQTLTAAKQAIINKWLAVKKSTASVNGAYWVSNYYFYRARAGSDTSLDNYDAPDSWSYVTVSQGHELDDDPVGSAEGEAMETELAEYYLEKQGRYRIYRKHGVLANDDDSFNWKSSLDVSYVTRRHVGNHKMVSEYNNVPDVPELASLVRGPGSEVNTYTGTIEWTKWDVNSSGNLENKTIEKLPVTDFLSWKTSKRTRQLCEGNQVIEAPHISASIARQIEKRSERYRKVVTDSFGRKRRLWKKRYKLYVVHVNQGDLYGN